MNYITLKGSHYKIGYQIGTLFSAKIREYIAKRYDLLNQEYGGSDIIARYGKFSIMLVNHFKKASPKEFLEISGLSDAAGVQIEDVIFALGYSDIFDLINPESKVQKEINLGEGCTCFIAPGTYSLDHSLYAGQNWDMPPGTSDYIFLSRKIYDDGSDFFSLSTVLGLTHIGINRQGICIGTTNLATKDTDIGLIFPILIQEALTKYNILDSVHVITKSSRASGHFYYLATADVGFAIEVSASQFVIKQINDCGYVHANHYTDKRFFSKSIEYSPSSRFREDFLKMWLEKQRGIISPEDYKTILGNHDGNLCRHITRDDKILSETCGSIIFNPAHKKMSISIGHPCVSKWNDFGFSHY